MNIKDFMGIINAILIICALAAIVRGIIKVADASKKGLGKGYKIRTVITSTISAVAFLIVASMLGGEMDESGEYIKVQHPIGIPDITYGQAIDRVCGNQKWSRMTSQSTTSGTAIVQMDADCIYADGEHKITI